MELDPSTGRLLQQFGDSFTQAIAADPSSGMVYVSSAAGIEKFDPITETFTHFSDVRVGSLAVSPQGELWAATWPERGTIVKFDQLGHAQPMLSFDNDIDSLAFGQPGSRLSGLLFVSSNDGANRQGASDLTMVDVVTLQRVAIGQGGTRGDVVATTGDGRILLSQSHQVDVLSAVLPPKVSVTSPADQTVVALPSGSLTVTFDHDMQAGPATDPRSVLNPANYTLIGATGSPVNITGVTYDPATHTARLTFDALTPDVYQLTIGGQLASTEGLGLAAPYVTHFTAASDFTPSVQLTFSNSRSDRHDGTISYDVTVKNVGSYDLRAPLTLMLDPGQYFEGQPLDTLGQSANGLWLIDLGSGLPGGVLHPGASTTVQTITVTNPALQHASLGHGVYAIPYPNQAPSFDSTPVTTATAGQPFTYQATAHDPDGVGLTYLLYNAPEGMTVDPATGLISWTPTAGSPADANVVLDVYDARGAHSEQSFTVQVTGGDHAPVFAPMPDKIVGTEGQTIQVPITATDVDQQVLTYLVDNLPPGASFDGQQLLLSWTPDASAAGTYDDVRLIVTDDQIVVTKTLTFVIQPVNQAPDLVRPADVTITEGHPLHLQLHATDPEGSPIRYTSSLLPGGATLNPDTGAFDWTPGYFQAGTFQIPFMASDGQASSTKTTTITVLNANAAPVFDQLGRWQVQEGQQLRFRAFATDPDNPGFIPQDRRSDGTLTPLEGTRPTVSYAAQNLPPGATFDSTTAMFVWTPNASQAGDYVVTFVATDTGDGTGTPASTTIQIPITVRDTNLPPVVPIIDSQTVQRDSTLDLTVTGSDPEGQPVALSIKNLPSFATFTDHGDGTGTIHIAPHANNRGDYTISVVATETSGAHPLSGSSSFVLSVTSASEPPHLGYIGDQVAVIGEPLSLILTATDMDQDPLTFSAATLPPGATLTPLVTYGRARLDWTPTAAGTYDVTFQVADSGNGNAALIATDQRTVHFVARAADQAPVLAPIGDKTASEGQALQIQLSATDADGDAITYAAANLPAGASLDPITGLLTWTPNFFQAGVYPNILLTATDGARSSSETITIQVANTDQAPVLVTMPLQSGREGAPLQFTLTVGDADGDQLTYAALTPMPAGATLNPLTGQFSWTPGFDQAGDYSVTFQSTDPFGLSDTMQVPLTIANVDRAPQFALSNHSVTLGQMLAFTLVGSDPDSGSTLRYSASGLPEGATVDPTTGRFTWTPGPGQAGDYPILFTVSDGERATTKSALIRAAITPDAPAVVMELTPGFPVVPGQKVLVHVIASSLAPISGLTLTFNGQPVALDAQGRARITAGAIGSYQLVATATDADGLVGQTQALLKVRDPQDQSSPIVAFAAGLDGTRIDTPLAVRGTISDTSLDHWTLERAAGTTDDFIEIARGSAPLLDGVLATIDPGTLANGFYQLRLTAVDVMGRTTRDTITVEVNSANKTAQYLRNETDLSLDMGGTPVNVVRQYDSLNNGDSSGFGNWRLATREFTIQTDVAATGREALGDYSPYRVGSRVYVTLPDGSTAGFTFQPVAHTLPGVTYYTPAFVADPGIAWSLQSAQALLTLGGSRAFDLKTAAPYNPASPDVTDVPFTLTSPDGTVYQLDATGRLQHETLPGGQSVRFADSGIAGPNGSQAQFLTDPDGHLAAITAPDGTRVLYSYDANGNLIGTRNLALGESTRYGYGANDRLMLATGPQGGEAIQYGGVPTTVPIVVDLGAAVQFLQHTTDGTLTAGQTQRYTFSVQQSEIHSTPTGIWYVGVEIQGQSGGILDPGAPSIAGLTPLAGHTESGRAYALFGITDPGLYELDVKGANATTAGSYRIRIVAAGDVNGDGKVDGVDLQAIAALVGKTQGDAGYVLAGDADGDGTISAADVQLLNKNFGFAANRPPTVTGGSVLTHEDLEVPFTLTSLATDPESDPVFFRVTSTVHGTAKLTPDGQTVLFTPEPGYHGAASFTYVADDGNAVSAPATVDVNVSDAALVNLDFGNRNPKLLQGQVETLEFVGDFADEPHVALPASYLQLSITNPSAAQLSTTGDLTAIGQGSGVITASSHGLQAVTAYTAGLPTETQDQFLYILGLDVFPQAVSLAAGSGQRQLSVKLSGQVDLTASSSGIQYFTSNASVATVTADGLINAGQPGHATITIINGPAEFVLPVTVETPHVGPTVLGTNGGVVQGAGGALVAVAPGVLKSDTTVSIDTLSSSAELPLAVPDFLDFAAAFQLNMGTIDEAIPAQVAVPVAPTIAPGTKVYFLRAADLPTPTGGTQTIWLEEEVGVVGNDGYARTTSRPYPGVRESGKWLVAVPGQYALGQVQGMITQYGEAYFKSYAMFTTIGAPIFGGSWVIDVLPGQYPVTILSIPERGLPVTTTTDVQVDPGTIAHSETTVYNFASDVNDPGAAPIVNSASVEYFNNQLVLKIVGQRFSYSDPSAPADIPVTETRVDFYLPGKKTPVSAMALDASDGTTLYVPIPKETIVGLADIAVSRPTWQRSSDSANGWVKQDSVGETFQLDAEARYVIAATHGNWVAFIDQASKSLSANVPVTSDQNYIDSLAAKGVDSSSVSPSTRSVAVTNDNTRAYVTLIGEPYVAVVDTVALQSVDVMPGTSSPGINNIDLLGALPYQIIVDHQDTFAYVSTDQGIAVIGIDPSAAYFHALKTMIHVNPAPNGLYGLALNQDGTRLYVAAWGRSAADSADGTVEAGNILVIDTNPADGSKYLTQIGTIPAGKEPFALAATTDPRLMTFTNRRGDANAYGVIKADETQTSWTVTYIAPPGLNLIPDADDFSRTNGFDVNDAQGVTLLPAGTLSPTQRAYAFVTGANYFVANDNTRDPDMHPFNPGGGNVGIIENPLGASPRLVAATRPIPFGYADNAVLSGDGKYLYVSYRDLGPDGGGAVFVFDVAQMINTLKATYDPSAASQLIANLATRIRQDAAASGTAIPSGTDEQLVSSYVRPLDLPSSGVLSGTELIRKVLDNKSLDFINPSISVRADYRLLTYDELVALGIIQQGAHDKPVFSVPPYYTNGTIVRDADGNIVLSPNAPIKDGGGELQGLAIQTHFIDLISPLSRAANLSTIEGAQPLVLGQGALETDLTPTFRWKTNVDVVEARLYVSVFPGGQGLFQSDFANVKLGLNEKGADLNYNRIVSGALGKPDAALGPGNWYFTLPDNLRLTAGQRYYWGVRTIDSAGDVFETSGQDYFETAPVRAAAGSFSGITIITPGIDGFQFLGKKSIPQYAFDMANAILRSDGGGTILVYNEKTGDWDLGDPSHNPSPQQTLSAGGPLILIANWMAEANITDSGFAEGAADALFASLIRLDGQYGGSASYEPTGAITYHTGSILSAPLHFIGANRGAVVNSEIIQRLGTLGSSAMKIQMTTLDPHDQTQSGASVPTEQKVQTSLDIPVEHWIDALVASAALISTGAAGVLGLSAEAAATQLLKLQTATSDTVAFERVLKVFGVDTIHFSNFYDPAVQVWNNVS